MGVSYLPKSVIIQWLQNKVQTLAQYSRFSTIWPQHTYAAFSLTTGPLDLCCSKCCHHLYVAMKQWKCGCCELTCVVSSIYVSDFEDEMPKKGCNISQYF